MDTLEPTKSTPTRQAASYTVGIGSSAGGLEALSAFFDAAPANSGLAFVVVTHLPSGHVSLLPELLARQSKMPVDLVCDGMEVQSNHVYVTPPGKNVAILYGVLTMTDPLPSADVHLPVDYFFRSLAADQRDRAICVVLSGTGTDGTLGLRAVKGAAGMAFVQDEASARYSGMPLSAASTGLADYVLRPELMPTQLVLSTRAPSDDEAPETTETTESRLALVLPRILELLRNHTGHDFGLYKSKTMRRRTERRMQANSIEQPDEYVQLLEKKPAELDLLFDELLIGVTSFFRDKEAFAALEAALTKLVAERSDDAALRVWVPACSTGEEAYSIGMLATEVAERLSARLTVQIFATDLDARGIVVARAGLYAEAAMAGVEGSRLERFFTREGRRYKVTKKIREMVVFAHQNVIKDPPFTKLDLVSCRNLLIYLNANLQTRLIPLFHYALNPGGLLLLGTSETTGPFDLLFEPIDRKRRLYQRRAAAVNVVPVTFPLSRPEKAAVALPALEAAPKSRGRSRSRAEDRDLERELERTRGTLRGTTEEFETSNEELKSTNEELQSINEELQSTNEELETSRADLQSLNTEFQTKLELLSRSNDDMQNMLRGAAVATLFLGKDLKITGFTDPIREVLSVIPSDVGRPVGDSVSNIEYDRLSMDARQVLDTGTPHELEVQVRSGEWRLLRIVPYRTALDGTDGVIVTFTDVDRVKRAELLAASRELAARIVDAVRESLVVLDSAFDIVTANRAFAKMFGLSERQTAGGSLFNVGREFFGLPRLRELLTNVVEHGSEFQDLEIEYDISGDGPTRTLLNARRLASDAATPNLVLLALSAASKKEGG